MKKIFVLVLWQHRGHRRGQRQRQCVPFCQWAVESTKDKCLVTSTGIYTVTGGAGAFANATGNGTISTQFDLCAGTASGTYTGTISKPH